MKYCFIIKKSSYVLDNLKTKWVKLTIGLKTILITSPEEHDGKSFIAANLAAAYSQEGKKVLYMLSAWKEVIIK